jgi:hypothetical protein
MTGTITNYPVGPFTPRTVRGEAIPQVHSGQVFWVSNNTTVAVRGAVGGSDTGKGSFERPFATLAYALTQAVTGRGDVIFIKPGHVETLGGVGVLTLSKDNTSVIGIGNYNTRPKFNMGTAATTTFLISGANCFVSNLWMNANFAAVTTCFAVTGVGAHIDNIRFTSQSAVLDFLTCVTASGAINTADGLMVTNCNWTTTTATDFSLVNFVNTAADVNIWNNHMVTSSTQATQFTCGNLVNIQTGKILTNADIGWNRVQNLMTSGEVLVSCDGSTNTGFVHNNYVQCADVTGTIDLGADVTGFGLFENLVVTTNVLSGFLLPAVDVNN